MYGMMPSAKIVSRRKLPPLKRSIMPSTDPWFCWNSCVKTSVLMPGVGMNAPKPIHRQHAQRKQDPIAQVRNAKHVGKRFEKLVHDSSSTLPPARAIFSCADLLNACARTVSAAFSSPSPKILIWRLA